VFYSGNAQDMQKQMGKEEFSRAISMEGVQRTMNSQIQERLKLIATGQPIPEGIEESEPEDITEPAEASDVVEEGAPVEKGASEISEETIEEVEPVDEVNESPIISESVPSGESSEKTQEQ